MNLTAKECLNMIMILIVKHFAPKTPVGLVNEAPDKPGVVIQDRATGEFYLIEIRKIESAKIVKIELLPDNIINHSQRPWGQRPWGEYNAN